MNNAALRSLSLTLTLATLAFVSACETAPPVQEMSDARQAIAVAKEAGAAEKAAMHLKAAEVYEKKLNDRQYSQARRDAKQAKMKALDALKATESPSESAEDDDK